MLTPQFARSPPPLAPRLGPACLHGAVAVPRGYPWALSVGLGGKSLAALGQRAPRPRTALERLDPTFGPKAARRAPSHGNSGPAGRADSGSRTEPPEAGWSGAPRVAARSAPALGRPAGSHTTQLFFCELGSGGLRGWSLWRGGVSGGVPACVARRPDSEAEVGNIAIPALPALCNRPSGRPLLASYVRTFCESSFGSRGDILSRSTVPFKVLDIR